MSQSYAKNRPGGTPDRPAPTIRRAAPADAEALVAIGRATFAETFGHLYPPEDLAAFLAEAHGLARASADLADPQKAVWLVEADGEAVGYAVAGPCKLPHPDVTPTCGELERIYLLASHQGGGAGGRLLAETLAWLEKDGPRRLWIGVWSENHGAQRLYARHGFEQVGTYEFAVGQTRDHEFILRRG
jgi:ribosomal protein S18 acetylase RimI-like enzyme